MDPRTTPTADLVVIAAHPDDAELAVGGILLSAQQQGFRTAVVDLTRGELSTRGTPETRAIETDRATEILGLNHRENLGLPDGDVRDTHDARLALAAVLRRLQPTVVLAPWKDDLHPDHAGAGQLAHRTWYLTGVRRFAPEVPAYRPPTLGYYMCHTSFEASVVFDVTEVWSRRMEAALAYASQFHSSDTDGEPATKISHPEFMEGVEGRARHYGLMVGATFGEPVLWEMPPRIQRWDAFLGRNSQ